MNRIQIMVDGVADLPKELIRTGKIEVIPCAIFAGGQEIATDFKTPVEKVRRLYERLRDGERVYTLPAMEDKIRHCLKKNLDEGEDILYLACCNKQSSSIAKTQRVVPEILKKFPEQRVYIIDTLNASMGIGLLAEKAVELAEKGKSLDEIRDTICGLRNRVVECCVPQKLKYLSATRKVEPGTAFFGDLFHIIPILTSDCEGRQCKFTQTKGREQSLRDCVDEFLKRLVEPEKQTIYIMHGDDEYAANFCKELIQENRPDIRDISIQYFTPIVGATTGPGTVALFGWGEETTFIGE